MPEGFNDGYADNSFTLSCPVCGEEYLHAKRVYQINGSDETGIFPLVGLHTAYPSGSWRRDAVAIEFEGETCQHRVILRVQQHKGNTFLSVETLKPDQFLPDDSSRIECARQRGGH